MLTVKPVGDQVLIELVEESGVSAGGIHLPENARIGSGSKRVVISALGDFPYADDKRIRKWPFEVGDFALIRNGSGLDVKVGAHNCQIVKCQDIVAIVDG